MLLDLVFWSASMCGLYFFMDVEPLIMDPTNKHLKMIQLLDLGLIAHLNRELLPHLLLRQVDHKLVKKRE